LFRRRTLYLTGLNIEGSKGQKKAMRKAIGKLFNDGIGKVAQIGIYSLLQDEPPPSAAAAADPALTRTISRAIGRQKRHQSPRMGMGGGGGTQHYCIVTMETAESAQRALDLLEYYQELKNEKYRLVQARDQQTTIKEAFRQQSTIDAAAVAQKKATTATTKEQREPVVPVAASSSSPPAASGDINLVGRLTSVFGALASPARVDDHDHDALAAAREASEEEQALAEEIAQNKQQRRELKNQYRIEVPGQQQGNGQSLVELKIELVSFELTPSPENFSLHHLHDIATAEHKKEQRTNRGTKDAGSLGGIAILTNTSTSRLRADRIGVERVELSRAVSARLRLNVFLAVLLAVILLTGMVLTTVALFQIIASPSGLDDEEDDDEQQSAFSFSFQVPVEQLFFPPAGCVSETTRTVHAWLLVCFWVPAFSLFAVIYPTWQLSLSLAVALAQDAVRKSRLLRHF
jgi:hypothetical protein